MSDVEKQIEQWHSSLAGSDTFTGADVEELEGHLREEMERLRPLGLSETESFLVARQRLGTTEALETEYAKVNADRRSLLRLSWMAVGVLVYVLAGYIAGGLSHGTMLAVAVPSAYIVGAHPSASRASITGRRSRAGPAQCLPSMSLVFPYCLAALPDPFFGLAGRIRH